MLTIDRSSSTSVHDQLLEQLRYHIASGQYKVDEMLPSTRQLADQVGVSFHTVRKVYQELEREGLLEGRPGSGFVVRERAPLSKGERMERGAAIVVEALQRLIGLGLAEEEAEYLFHEQMSLLKSTADRYKLLCVAPYREMAEACAAQLTSNLQQPVDPATLAALDRHHDADYVFTTFPLMHRVMELLPRADVVGMATYVAPEALARVARLLGEQTLGIITRSEDAVPPLMQELRSQTGFSGQMLAALLDESTGHLQRFMEQTDLIVFTPACRRRLKPLLQAHPPHAVATHFISRESLETIRQTVPA